MVIVVGGRGLFLLFFSVPSIISISFKLIFYLFFKFLCLLDFDLKTEVIFILVSIYT